MADIPIIELDASNAAANDDADESSPHPHNVLQSPQGKLLYRLIAFIAFVMLVWFLREVQTVMMPLAIAILAAVVVGPITHRLNRVLPGWLSLAVAMSGVVISLLAFIGLLGWLAYEMASEISNMMPTLRDKAAPIVDKLQKWGMDPSASGFGERARDFVMQGINSVTSGLSGLVIVLFLTGFMLSEASHLKKKSGVAFDSGVRRRLAHTVKAMATPVRQYILVKTAISAFSGTVTALVSWAFGLEQPLMLGALTFVLNYIPNFGSILALIPPVLFGLVQLDSLALATALGVVLGGIDMLVGYYVEPRFMGESLQLSPVVVLLALVFWGWLWGLVGVFVAVPLTVALKVICCHFDFTRPIGILLGGDPDCDQVLESSAAYAVCGEERNGKLILDDRVSEPRQSAEPSAG